MFLSVFLLLLAVAVTCKRCLADDFSPEGPLAGEYPWRRHFLDAMVVEESQNVKRVFHQPRKHRSNPVMAKERAWEGAGPNARTIMFEDNTFRMWYSGAYRGKPCYAESSDGIHWARPELGFVEYNGSKANNIVIGEAGLRIRKPQSAKFRWAMFGGRKTGPFVAFSSDGFNWRLDEAKEALFETSDVRNYFYDPYNVRYVATYKTPNRRHRAVGLAYSKDAMEWWKPIQGPVFGADDYDPDGTQIYGMPVFPYQGVYIGLPWIYHARFIKYGKYTTPKQMYEAEADYRRTIDTQLAWSWDLVSWNRTAKRKPFVGLGRPGSWDQGMVFVRQAPIVVEDKLYFYYSASDGLHDDVQANVAIGLAVLRLDGFCSMRAGDKEGQLISRRELFRTPRVSINAKTAPNGYIAAELLDRNNNVLKGFSRKDCRPFEGDSVNAVLSWKSRKFSRKIIEADKKIRFFLRNANLYSYLPENINTDIDTSNRLQQ